WTLRAASTGVPLSGQAAAVSLWSPPMAPRIATTGARHDHGPRVAAAAFLGTLLSAIVTVHPASARGPMFAAAFQGLDTGGAQPTDIKAADFNGDGHLDLAVSTVSGQVFLFLGNGDGTFRPNPNLPGIVFCMGVVAGDFNGDGRVDLAFA